MLPQTEYMELTGSKVVLNLTGLDNMKHVEPNDFVIHLRSFQGGIERSSFRGKVSNAYTVLSPRSEVDPGYFRWVLKAPGFVQELATTAEQLRDGQSIRFDQFARVGLPLPPLAEQRRIADFLDDQVTRIDALTQARDSQMAAIVEYGESAIDTVLWGDAGSSRSAQPMRNFTREIVVGIVVQPASYYTDDVTGIPAVRGTDISPSRINMTDLVRISEEGHRLHPRSELQDGDLLVVRTGLAGAAAVVPPELVGANTISNVIARPMPGVDSHFLEMVINSRTSRLRIERDSVGAMQQHFGVGAMKSLPVPVVSQAEQSQIVEGVHEVRGSVGAILQAERSFQSCLSDLKRSLITAAVTGELDVTMARRGLPV